MHRLTASSFVVRLFLLVAIATVIATAAENGSARFGAGVKLGANTTGWFQDVTGRGLTSYGSGRFTIGPFAEVRIWNLFAIEAGALYRGIERRSSGDYPSPLLGFSQEESGSAWEFPVLGKFRIPSGFRSLRPFVAAGPVFYRAQSTERWHQSSLVAGPDGRPVTSESSGTDRVRDWGAGLALGGGLEKAAGRARLSVEGRFTFWPGQTVNVGGLGCYLRCHQSPQFVILGGIGF